LPRDIAVNYSQTTGSPYPIIAMKTLSQEEQKQLDSHLNAISDILFRNSDTEKLKTFEALELNIRDHVLTTVGPAMLKNFQPIFTQIPQVAPEL